ncbi:MAG: DUF3764 family protein [Candidatus Zixiibacteriota bacterium]
MPHLLVHHKVADFDEWKRVFDSHATAQREAGLHIDRIFRGIDDPSEITLLFEVTNLERARAFVASSDVPRAQSQSGVIGTPEIRFLA